MECSGVSWYGPTYRISIHKFKVHKGKVRSVFLILCFTLKLLHLRTYKYALKILALLLVLISFNELYSICRVLSRLIPK